MLVCGGSVTAYGVMARSFFQRWFVEMLVVAEAQRRRGHGAALLAALEARAWRDGELWTSTNRSNRPMRALLRSRGYVPRGRVTGLDAGDAELFFMKKAAR